MPKKRNEANERIKRRYLEYRKFAGQLGEASLDKEAAAIERFDMWNARKDYRRFHIEQAMGFRNHLEAEVNPRTGKLLGRSTRDGIMKPLQQFFAWLSGQDGYRSRIRASDSAYFSLSKRDTAIARAANPLPAPSREQSATAFAAMPSASDTDRRDRAVFALLLLTGIRDGALIGLRLKHIDTTEKWVWQNPKEDVQTKFGKAIRSYFFPGFPEAEAALADWITYQRQTLLRGDDDPLFPKTQVGVGTAGGFEAVGLTRGFWSSAATVRKIVNEAFARVGVQSFGPHRFRHMHARRAMREGATVEEFWAASQNLGHSSMLTTLGSYGQLPEERRREIILRD